MVSEEATTRISTAQMLLGGGCLIPFPGRSHLVLSVKNSLEVYSTN